MKRFLILFCTFWLLLPGMNAMDKETEVGGLKIVIGVLQQLKSKLVQLLVQTQAFMGRAEEENPKILSSQEQQILLDVERDYPSFVAGEMQYELKNVKGHWQDLKQKVLNDFAQKSVDRINVEKINQGFTNNILFGIKKIPVQNYESYTSLINAYNTLKGSTDVALTMDLVMQALKRGGSTGKKVAHPEVEKWLILGAWGDKKKFDKCFAHNWVGAGNAPDESTSLIFDFNKPEEMRNVFAQHNHEFDSILINVNTVKFLENWTFEHFQACATSLKPHGCMYIPDEYGGGMVDRVFVNTQSTITYLDSVYNQLTNKVNSSVKTMPMMQWLQKIKENFDNLSNKHIFLIGSGIKYYEYHHNDAPIKNEVSFFQQKLEPLDKNSENYKSILKLDALRVEKNIAFLKEIFKQVDYIDDSLKSKKSYPCRNEISKYYKVCRPKLNKQPHTGLSAPHVFNHNYEYQLDQNLIQRGHENNIDLAWVKSQNQGDSWRCGYFSIFNGLAIQNALSKKPNTVNELIKNIYEFATKNDTFKIIQKEIAEAVYGKGNLTEFQGNWVCKDHLVEKLIDFGKALLKRTDEYEHGKEVDWKKFLTVVTHAYKAESVSHQEKANELYGALVGVDAIGTLVDVNALFEARIEGTSGAHDAQFSQALIQEFQLKNNKNYFSSSQCLADVIAQKPQNFSQRFTHVFKHIFGTPPKTQRELVITDLIKQGLVGLTDNFITSGELKDRFSDNKPPLTHIIYFIAPGHYIQISVIQKLDNTWLIVIMDSAGVTSKSDGSYEKHIVQPLKNVMSSLMGKKID